MKPAHKYVKVLKSQNHKVKVTGDSRLIRGSSTLYPDRVS